MAKKKRVQLEAWCWYCDREFEDDKVLLQHQKAKHYKCPQCPRRLNTAGGLTVHLHQVHKSEPGRIENALPGRDSFDIEIYGMEGIPEADLAEWQARRAANGDSGGGGGQQPSQKRQKIENVALTPQELKAQLEAHKALMNGQAPPPGATIAPTYATPPPQSAPYSGPPPPGPWMATGSAAPPSGYNGPPPAFPPPAPVPQQPSPHQMAVRNGAKNRIVYSDTMLSPEEKLASTSKYLYFDPDDARPPPTTGYDQQQQYAYPPPPQQHAYMSQPHLQPPPSTGYYSGPPPSWPPPVSGYPSSASPYTAGSPQGAANNSPFPVPSPMSPNGGMASQAMHTAAGSPPYPNHPPAQSYPAYPPGAAPPSERPWENTAEALATANQSVAPQAREADTAYMESKAQHEQRVDAADPEPIPATSPEDTTTDPSSSQSESNVVKSTGGRRAKAADLF